MFLLLFLMIFFKKHTLCIAKYKRKRILVKKYILQKKILIINSHPDKDSFNYALSAKYANSALLNGALVEVLDLYKLKFKHFFKGIDLSNDIEPDIIKAQSLIRWADHIVFVFPIWWATFPALLKSFLERVLVPTFSVTENNKPNEFFEWHNLLNGKTARIIATMDSPPLFYILKVKNPAFNTIKDILNFCGINKVRKTYFGPMKVSDHDQRTYWLNKAENLGKKFK